MRTFLEYISEVTKKFIKDNKTSRKFEILFCLHEAYIPGKNWQKIFDIISGLKSNTVLEWRGNYKLPKSEKLLIDYDTFVKIDENTQIDFRLYANAKLDTTELELVVSGLPE